MCFSVGFTGLSTLKKHSEVYNAYVKNQNWIPIWKSIN